MACCVYRVLHFCPGCTPEQGPSIRPSRLSAKRLTLETNVRSSSDVFPTVCPRKSALQLMLVLNSVSARLRVVSGGMICVCVAVIVYLSISLLSFSSDSSYSCYLPYIPCRSFLPCSSHCKSLFSSLNLCLLTWSFPFFPPLLTFCLSSYHLFTFHSLLLSLLSLSVSPSLSSPLSFSFHYSFPVSPQYLPPSSVCLFGIHYLSFPSSVCFVGFLSLLIHIPFFCLSRLLSVSPHLPSLLLSVLSFLTLSFSLHRYSPESHVL